MVYSTGGAEKHIDSKIDITKLQEKTNLPILENEFSNDPILLNDKKYIIKLAHDTNLSIYDGESSLQIMLNDILERRVLHKAFYFDDEHPGIVKRVWLNEVINSLDRTKSAAESAVRICERIITELTDEYNKSLKSANEVDDEKEYYELLYSAHDHDE